MHCFRIASMMTLGICWVVVLGCGGNQAPEDAVTAAQLLQVDSRPTILGADVPIRQEMRRMILAYLDEHSVGGDREQQVKQAMDAALAQLRRPADELGIKPGTGGNLAWPEELRQEIVAPLRAEFEAGTLFDTHKVDLPVWAAPLLDEYKSGNMSSPRRELLFILASASIIARMS